MNAKSNLCLALFCLVFAVNFSFAQKARIPAQPASQTFTVLAEPNATIWLNGVSYGTTDETGKFVVSAFPEKVAQVKVRAYGYKEITQNMKFLRNGELKFTLVKTTDKAELAFQEAEKYSAADKAKAAEFYRKAIELRPRYPEAFVGLARVFSDSGNYEDALKAIAGARKILPVYPEASVVEGRIFKSDGDEEKAIASFKRGIREGNGIQPEANTGLALLYKEKAEFAGSSGDFEAETEHYEEALKYFAPAVKQLYGSPDAIIVFQMYGLVYEKMGRNKEAIRVYEDFLRIFPNLSESAAVRSFIVQLKNEANP